MQFFHNFSIVQWHWKIKIKFAPKEKLKWRPWGSDERWGSCRPPVPQQFEHWPKYKLRYRFVFSSTPVLSRCPTEGYDGDLKNEECQTRMSDITGTLINEGHICTYDSTTKTGACNVSSETPVETIPNERLWLVDVTYPAYTWIGYILSRVQTLLVHRPKFKTTLSV